MDAEGRLRRGVVELRPGRIPRRRVRPAPSIDSGAAVGVEFQLSTRTAADQRTVADRHGERRRLRGRRGTAERRRLELRRFARSASARPGPSWAPSSRSTPIPPCTHSTGTRSASTPTATSSWSGRAIGQDAAWRQRRLRPALRFRRRPGGRESSRSTPTCSTISTSPYVVLGAPRGRHATPTATSSWCGSSYLQDGSVAGAFGQRFASTGAKVGGEFQINVPTADQQARPSAAIDADGDFVVAWDGDW